MSKKTEVVLLMLTYNHEDCISEAIHDLINQEYQDFTLVIIDDNSTDNTWNVVNRISDSKNRIICFRNERNLGGAGNFKYSANFALTAYPEAKFFSWIGPDDRYNKRWLSELMQASVSQPTGTIFQSYCTYDYGDHQTTRMYESLLHPIKPIQYATILQNGYGQLLHGLWKKEVMELFNNYTLTSLDTFFKLESFSICYLFQSGDFIAVPEILMTKRKFLSSGIRYPKDKLYGNISMSWPAQSIILMQLTFKLALRRNFIFLILPLILNLKITLLESFRFRVLTPLRAVRAKIQA